MAQFNENIKIVAPNPIDDRYLSTRTSGGSQLPYSASSEVYALPDAVKYVGMTVLIESGGTNVEYWYKNGITDPDLVEKKFASEQLVGDFITGATNMGYFSGTTGIQTLVLAGSGFGANIGNYFSEYNWYYADSSNIVRIGTPTHNGPLRRAYVNAARTKSWIYSVNSGAWQVSLNDVVANVGNSLIVSPHTGYVFTGVTFSGSEGSATASTTAYGSLSTGSTLTIGAPVYSHKDSQDLYLRTPISDTPEFLQVEADDNYIRFSGVSSVISGTNVGSTGTGTAGVFKSKTGSTMQFRRLRSSGDTTVTQVGDEIRIYSAGGTGSISVVNLSGGTGEIYKNTTGTTMNLRTLKGTGDVTITTTGDTVIIDSQAGGTYDLGSPSVIPLGGICAGTVLTGKTSFELWEELLVPTQYPSLTNPSVSTTLSASGTYEVGTTISSLDVCSSYNPGSINPQYTAASSCRSNGVIGYCYTSTAGCVDGYYADTVTLHVETIPTYTISAGTQIWGTSACRCSGVQPYDSKGDPYMSGLTEGFTTVSSANLSGIYAWFWGSSVSAPTINQALLNSYTTKCLASSAGKITVTNYNVSGEYIWFAIPADGPTKTIWQGLNNPSNNGTIPDSFMGTPQVIGVTSPDGCGWSCNYEFYVSNYATSINYGMDFCN